MSKRKEFDTKRLQRNLRRLKKLKSYVKEIEASVKEFEAKYGTPAPTASSIGCPVTQVVDLTTEEKNH